MFWPITGLTVAENNIKLEPSSPLSLLCTAVSGCLSTVVSGSSGQDIEIKPETSHNQANYSQHLANQMEIPVSDIEVSPSLFPSLWSLSDIIFCFIEASHRSSPQEILIEYYQAIKSPGYVYEVFSVLLTNTIPALIWLKFPHWLADNTNNDL